MWAAPDFTRRNWESLRLNENDITISPLSLFAKKKEQCCQVNPPIVPTLLAMFVVIVFSSIICKVCLSVTCHWDTLTQMFAKTSNPMHWWLYSSLLGKPLAEAAGEIGYGSSFIEWFRCLLELFRTNSESRLHCFCLSAKRLGELEARLQPVPRELRRWSSFGKFIPNSIICQNIWSDLDVKLV